MLKSKELLLDSASCYGELIKLQEAAQEEAATGKYIMEVLVLKERKYILETMYREFEDVALENLRKRLWSKFLKLGWSGKWYGASISTASHYYVLFKTLDMLKGSSSPKYS